MAYIGQAPTNAPLTSSDIQDGVIVAADLAPNSVDSSELVDGSIDTSHLSSSLTLTTPNLGTPSAGVVTNLSGVLPVEVTGGSGLNASNIGCSQASLWYLTSSSSGNVDPISSNLAELSDMSNVSYSRIGSAMVPSSGIWTFPETGIWRITFHCQSNQNAGMSYITAWIKTTTNDGSNWYGVAIGSQSSIAGATNAHKSVAETLFDVTDVATHKVAFQFHSHGAGGTLYGEATPKSTCFIFQRLGDT